MKIYSVICQFPLSLLIFPLALNSQTQASHIRRNETVHLVDRSGSDRDSAACCNPLRWQQHPGVSMGTTPARHLLPPLSLKYRTWLLLLQLASFITLVIHKYVRFCRQWQTEKGQAAKLANLGIVQNIKPNNVSELSPDFFLKLIRFVCVTRVMSVHWR